MSYTKTIRLFSFKSWFKEPLSPHALMVKFVDTGDPALLSELYDMAGGNLYYYLLVMSDPETAADIAQKSWVRVIERKHQYNKQNNFEAWLFTIARNLLIDESRKNKRLSFNNEKVEQFSAPHCHQDDAVDFHQHLKKLPFAQREAFSLQQEGFSVIQIAEICSVPPETIKTRLRYARTALKQTLGS